MGRTEGDVPHELQLLVILRAGRQRPSQEQEVGSREVRGGGGDGDGDGAGGVPGAGHLRGHTGHVQHTRAGQ